jgi:hypothetical protein
MTGLGEKNTSAQNYTNDMFFHKRVRFNFNNITHFGLSLNPKNYQFYNTSLSTTWGNSTSEKISSSNLLEVEDFLTKYNSFNNFCIVYGGYIYTNQEHKTKLLRDDAVFNVTVENDFSKFYKFDGKRINRKFIEHTDANTIKCYNYYVYGKLSYANEQILAKFPYSNFFTA